MEKVKVQNLARSQAKKSLYSLGRLKPSARCVGLSLIANCEWAKKRIDFIPFLRGSP
ncbi:hypothetical protein GXM_01089 [Nostoc sphaeroides CCNUC1]|uniref:Uncharacterized protein n=1 Tax=Nostoc sphaeroides CCNUC1 TaxID=2653204 RepID=A0A5P8VU09_9NOSO|nr:hypothetical protein GXM_01089 [Nostoc sphaeroides CCNUC1]